MARRIPTFMARRSKQKHGVYNQHDSYNTSRPASADTREGEGRGGREKQQLLLQKKPTIHGCTHARAQLERKVRRVRAATEILPLYPALSTDILESFTRMISWQQCKKEHQPSSYVAASIMS
jgi:hypothetical protein